MATLNVPVGGFKYSDLFDAMKNTNYVSSTSTTATFTFSPSGPSGLIVYGTGFVADPVNGGLTAGTITGVDYVGFEGTTLWSIRGLSGFVIGNTTFEAASTALDGGDPSLMMALIQTNAWNVTGSFTNDDIIGGSKADVLRGGLGHDTFVGNAGNDTIVGGPWTGVFLDDTNLTDFDAVDYSQEKGSLGITVDMTLASGQVHDTYGNIDTLKGIELIIGTSKADNMKGGNATNQYDAFTGGAGNDTIDGGGGSNDEVRYDREKGGTFGIVVDLDSVSGTQGTATDTFGNTDSLLNIEHVRGTLLNDKIQGNALDNRLTGLKGNDTLDGGAGNDWVRYDFDEGVGVANNLSTSGVRVNLAAGVARDGFGTVDTLISIENVRGTDFYDRLSGSGANNVMDGQGGADWISGFGGNDTLFGQDGNDMLLGGAGNDSLDGGRGSDILNGGAGNDTLTGNFGFDIFAFSGAVSAANLGADVINDFEHGRDLIDLSGVVNGTTDQVTGLASLQITDTANGVQIAFVADPTVTILVKGGGLAANFTAADFIF